MMHYATNNTQTAPSLPEKKEAEANNFQEKLNEYSRKTIQPEVKPAPVQPVIVQPDVVVEPAVVEEKKKKRKKFDTSHLPVKIFNPQPDKVAVAETEPGKADKVEVINVPELIITGDGEAWEDVKTGSSDESGDFLPDNLSEEISKKVRNLKEGVAYITGLVGNIERYTTKQLLYLREEMAKANSSGKTSRSIAKSISRAYDSGKISGGKIATLIDDLKPHPITESAKSTTRELSRMLVQTDSVTLLVDVSTTLISRADDIRNVIRLVLENYGQDSVEYNYKYKWKQANIDNAKMLAERAMELNTIAFNDLYGNGNIGPKPIIRN